VKDLGADNTQFQGPANRKKVKDEESRTGVRWDRKAVSPDGKKGKRRKRTTCEKGVIEQGFHRQNREKN